MSSTPTLKDPSRGAFATSRLTAMGAALTTFIAPAAYAPYVARGPVLCPWHGLLGLPCPGCGLTRAFCALARLDLRAALALNAISVPLLIALLVVPVVAASELVRGRPYAWYRGLGSSSAAYGCGATIMAYHTARVAYWIAQGTLVDTYLKTSWTYAWYQAFAR